jgi:hypothetical protein
MAFIICEDDDFIEAGEFYAKMLGIPDDAIIAISLHNNLDVAGYCVQKKDSILPYYIIALDRTDDDEDREDPLSVLAHEFIHVKQYTLGQLKDEGMYSYWKGKKYENAEPDSKEYYFSPWEVEAFGMQVGLYRLYMRSIENELQ